MTSGFTVVPNIDPNLDAVARLWDVNRKTLTHWRGTDYYRHKWVMATPPEYGEPWRMRLGLDQEVSLFAAPFGSPANLPLTDNDVCIMAPALPEVIAIEARADAMKDSILEASKLGLRARLYARVEGQKLTDMERWIHRLPLKEIDGFYFSSAQTPDALLHQIILGCEYGADKQLHFAGVQGEEKVSIMAVLSWRKPSLVSIDTSTHLAGTALMYLPPGELSHGLRLVKGDKMLTALPCDCPVCSAVSVDTMYESAPHRNLHNLQQVMRGIRMYSAVQQNREWYVSNLAAKGVRDLFQLWNVYKERGYEYAFRNALAIRLPRGQRQLIEPEYYEGKVVVCAFCGKEPSGRRYDQPICRECDSFYEVADRAVGGVNGAIA
jgi:hypothetical protein